MKDPLDETEVRTGSEELKAYCPWCVGSEESARLQDLGYTGRVCKKHLVDLLRQVEQLRSGGKNGPNS